MALKLTPMYDVGETDDTDDTNDTAPPTAPVYDNAEDARATLVNPVYGRSEPPQLNGRSGASRVDADQSLVLTGRIGHADFINGQYDLQEEVCKCHRPPSRRP